MTASCAGEAKSLSGLRANLRFHPPRGPSTQCHALYREAHRSKFGSKDSATNDLIYLNSYQLSKFGRVYMKIGYKGVTKAQI